MATRIRKSTPSDTNIFLFFLDRTSHPPCCQFYLIAGLYHTAKEMSYCILLIQVLMKQTLLWSSVFVTLDHNNHHKNPAHKGPYLFNRLTLKIVPEPAELCHVHRAVQRYRPTYECKESEIRNAVTAVAHAWLHSRMGQRLDQPITPPKNAIKKFGK